MSLDKPQKNNILQNSNVKQWQHTRTTKTAAWHKHLATTGGKQPTKSKWTIELKQPSRRQLSFSKNKNICLKECPIVNCMFISIHHVWHSPRMLPNTYPSWTCGGTTVQSFVSVCCFNAHKGFFPHAMQCQFLIKATKPNALYKDDTLNMNVDHTGCGG